MPMPIEKLSSLNYELSSFFYDDHPELLAKWDLDEAGYLDQSYEENYYSQTLLPIISALHHSPEKRSYLIESFLQIVDNTSNIKVLEIIRLQNLRHSQGITEDKDTWLTQQILTLSPEELEKYSQLSTQSPKPDLTFELKTLVTARNRLRQQLQQAHYKVLQSMVPSLLKVNPTLSRFLESEEGYTPSQAELRNFGVAIEDAQLQMKMDPKIKADMRKNALFLAEAEKVIIDNTPMLLQGMNVLEVKKTIITDTKNREIQRLTKQLTHIHSQYLNLSQRLNQPHKTDEAIQSIGQLSKEITPAMKTYSALLSSLQKEIDIYENPKNATSQQLIRERLAQLMHELDGLEKNGLIKYLHEPEFKDLIHKVTAAIPFLENVKDTNAKLFVEALRDRILNPNPHQNKKDINTFTDFLSQAWPLNQILNVHPTMLAMNDQMSMDTSKDLKAILARGYQEEMRLLQEMQNKLSKSRQNLEQHLNMAKSDLDVKKLDPDNELSVISLAVKETPRHLSEMLQLQSKVKELLSSQSITPEDYALLFSTRRLVEDSIRNAEHLSQALTFDREYGENLVRAYKSAAHSIIEKTEHEFVIDDNDTSEIDKLSFSKLRFLAGNIQATIQKKLSTYYEIQLRILVDIQTNVNANSKIILPEALIVAIRNSLEEKHTNLNQAIEDQTNKINSLKKSPFIAAKVNDTLKAIDTTKQNIVNLQKDVQIFNQKINHYYSELNQALTGDFQETERFLQKMRMLMNKTTLQEHSGFNKKLNKQIQYYNDILKCHQNFINALVKEIQNPSSETFKERCVKCKNDYEKNLKTIQAKYIDIKETKYLHAKLEGSRFYHQFEVTAGEKIKAKLKGLKGDALKTHILLDVKTELDRIVSQDELESFINNFKLSDEYQILNTGQGFMTQKFNLETSSIKAFNEMIAEKQDLIKLLSNP